MYARETAFLQLPVSNSDQRIVVPQLLRRVFLLEMYHKYAPAIEMVCLAFESYTNFEEAKQEAMRLAASLIMILSPRHCEKNVTTASCRCNSQTC